MSAIEFCKVTSPETFRDAMRKYVHQFRPWDLGLISDRRTPAELRVYLYGILGIRRAALLFDPNVPVFEFDKVNHDFSLFTAPNPEDASLCDLYANVKFKTRAYCDAVGIEFNVEEWRGHLQEVYLDAFNDLPGTDKTEVVTLASTEVKVDMYVDDTGTFPGNCVACLDVKCVLRLVDAKKRGGDPADVTRFGMIPPLRIYSKALDNRLEMDDILRWPGTSVPPIVHQTPFLNADQPLENQGVLRVFNSDGIPYYPKWQFEDDGSICSIVNRLRNSSRKPNMGEIFWFFNMNYAALDGKTPLQVLKEKGDIVSLMRLVAIWGDGVFMA